MELVKKIGTKLSKTGKSKSSYGVFKCPFDLKEVIMKLTDGYKAKSCGCKTNELISIANSGENHPMYGKNQTEETRQKMSEAKLGKKATEETRQKMSKTRIEREIAKGKNNPMYGKYGKDHPAYGYKHTEKHRQYMSELLKKYKGELASNWQNGKSFEEYGIEFNKEFKQIILERDNYTCQDPNCKHLSDTLDCHHIDYDKKNNRPENIIVLCRSCHVKTFNKNKRISWKEFYQNTMMGKVMECLL